jgi:hypothetical protein
VGSGATASPPNWTHATSGGRRPSAEWDAVPGVDAIPSYGPTRAELITHPGRNYRSVGARPYEAGVITVTASSKTNSPDVDASQTTPPAIPTPGLVA